MPRKPPGARPRPAGRALQPPRIPLWTSTVPRFDCRSLPDLPTLDQPPSWCNFRGRVDRSACIELRVSEARVLAGCITFQNSRTGTQWRKAHDMRPLPIEAPCRNGRGRIASGVIIVTAEMLHRMHRTRRPRKLMGDWRTQRAPAMRTPYWRPQQGFTLRVRRNADPLALDLGLEGNPNKGACRTKMIGVSESWSQPLRMEKWVYPRRIRPAYFFICPGHARQELPPLSTRRPGREDPATGRCPQRCLKLLMVQCTMQEYRDATLAQLWIQCLPRALRLRQPARDIIATIIRRYGPILQPRLMLCPRCLGARYGNDPESARQSWRRRQGKANAAPPRRGRARRAARAVDQLRSTRLAQQKARREHLRLTRPQREAQRHQQREMRLAMRELEKTLRQMRRAVARERKLRELYLALAAAKSDRDFFRALAAAHAAGAWG